MTATGTLQAGARVGEPAQVEMLLAQIESLPTLPEVAARLLELTGDGVSSSREVSQIIESDQSLSASLLSMVARANLGTTAHTVERAVLLLGLDVVRSLVLSIQIFETFSHRVEPAAARLNRVGFWKHSLAVGCAARLLAQQLVREGRAAAASLKAEEAFVCGLLHDIGKVVLDACFPKSYARVLARVEDSRGCIADVEQETLGVDHTAAGQRLAMHWKLPPMIRESIWLHHHVPGSTPKRIAHGEYVGVVQIADRLARELHIGYSGNYAVEGPASALAEAIGVSPTELHEVCAALPELIEARAKLIGLDRLTANDVYQEALAQTHGELARLNGSLMQANRRLEQRCRCFEALRAVNAVMSDELLHEEVCRAGVEAMSVVMGAGAAPLAVCSVSASRSLLVIAVTDGTSSPPRVTVLPASAAGDVSSTCGLASGWLRASTLPGCLLDCLLAAIGRPPTWCRPLRHQQRLVGIAVLAGEAAGEADESLEALSDGLGVWLSSAESRAVARQLNEELAEMNRHLLGTQTELARMRSRAMVGEMAAGAAHELNNPLAVISGRAQMLNRPELPEEVRRTALLIADHAHRASGIVQELMEFAKPAPPEPSDWPLAPLLAELRREWSEKSALSEEQFRLELSDDLPAVHADASQIRRLFDEVIRNAAESMRETPRPSLVINCRADLADESMVIRIQDNGCGMSADILERATDPFFSHRPAGRGRGMGLSRAVRYAEINGGQIRLSSVPDQGTVVFVTLPLAKPG